MRLFACFLLIVAGMLAADIKLGKPLALKHSVAVDELLASPGAHIGKTVQVKGKVTEVCQAMGCWMNLVSESGKSIRIKVDDGEIVFPKDAPGRTAIAEGKLSKIELTKDQAIARARHEAEESNKKFDAASIKSGATEYQIQGSGAVILSN
jgi:hypothetical protein